MTESPIDEHEREHPLTQERIIKWAKNVAAAIIGAGAITAAWLSIGLPVPATTAYVVAEVHPIAERVVDLEKYAKSTRIILLRQRQGSLLEEIRKLEEEALRSDNPHLRHLITIKKREVDEIERQISSTEGAVR